MPAMSTIRRARRSDAGMTTSQVAVLFPALLFGIMLIVQYGLWFHAKQVVETAAAEAVDAAQTPTGTEADGTAAAESLLATSGNLTGVRVSVDRTSTVVTVQITGDAPQLVPGFRFSVEARAEAPVERFVVESDR